MCISMLVLVNDNYGNQNLKINNFEQENLFMFINICIYQSGTIHNSSGPHRISPICCKLSADSLQKLYRLKLTFNELY